MIRTPRNTVNIANIIVIVHSVLVDADSWQQLDKQKRLGLSGSTIVTPGGTLAPVGNANFNKYLADQLHNPHIVKPHPPPDSRGYAKRERVPSAASQRAKRGHTYWIDDGKKKVSTAGRCCNLTIYSHQ